MEKENKSVMNIKRRQGHKEEEEEVGWGKR